MSTHRETEYLGAALPETFQILGRTLQPFSLGHAMLLRRHSLLPPRAANDLFLAVWLCAQPFELALSGLRDPALRRDLPAWRRLAGKFDLAQRLKLFADYIAAGSRCPPYAVLSDRVARRTPGAPPDLILLVTLLTHLRLGLSAALNLPLGWAQWLFCAYWETQGSLQIRNQADELAVAAVGRLWDELKAEAEAGGLRWLWKAKPAL
jgi:hypothetical protein